MNNQPRILITLPCLVNSRTLEWLGHVADARKQSIPEVVADLLELNVKMEDEEASFLLAQQGNSPVTMEPAGFREEDAPFDVNTVSTHIPLRPLTHSRDESGFDAVADQENRSLAPATDV